MLCERGPDLVAALLGVNASGAAYVPLDAVYPTSRLAMLEDPRAKCVIGNAALTSTRIPSVPALHLETIASRRVPNLYCPTPYLPRNGGSARIWPRSNLAEMIWPTASSRPALPACPKECPSRRLAHEPLKSFLDDLPEPVPGRAPRAAGSSVTVARFLSAEGFDTLDEVANGFSAGRRRAGC